MSFKLIFEAKTQYVKKIPTKSGTPFTIGKLTSKIPKAGYVNLKFKAFGNIAESLDNGMIIKGVGDLVNSNIDKGAMEITISDYEIISEDELENNEYTSSIEFNGSNDYVPTSNSKKTKSKVKDEGDDIFDDIDEDDMPF